MNQSKRILVCDAELKNCHEIPGAVGCQGGTYERKVGLGIISHEKAKDICVLPERSKSIHVGLNLSKL